MPAPHPFQPLLGFVLVAKKVQYSVTEQPLHLPGERVPLDASLPLRRLHRDHHVSQQIRPTRDQLLGEGKHIGRRVVTPVLPVDLSDESIVAEDHAEFRRLVRLPRRGVPFGGR